MTIGIRFAARSDVGMLREGNEDSAYAGPRLLVVADGMGGHVGGEIASAAAIETVKRLDADVPATELVAALEHAVRQANETLRGIVETDPALQGMGTTLTAMLWQGGQVALVHIGDSRAYLLRNGELFQITHDHTLVQSLVDEGRISPDEAASHPQRSLLLRALDGRSEVEPDVSLREAQLGDRYLLCSDGLSSVVSPETVHHALTTVADQEQAIRQLIELANRGGGPDNITCVIADVIDVEPQGMLSAASIVAGAAQHPSHTRSEADSPPDPPPGAMAEETPAQRAAALRDTKPQPAAVDAPPAPVGMPLEGAVGRPAPMRQRHRWTWLVIALVVLVILVAAGGFVGWRYTQSQYFVGVNDNDQVVIYQGIHQKIAGLDLSTVKETPEHPLKLSDLPEQRQKEVTATIDVAGLEKARATVKRLRQEVCKIIVTADAKGLVGLWKGRGQSGCQNVALPAPKPAVSLDALTKATRQKVRAGIPFITKEKADAEVKKLRDEANRCKHDPESLAGCPGQKP